MIAMALSLSPSILIADEPTTALDVTVQAQILALMDGLKEKFNTAIILITHDLGVVAENAQRVAVMYAGKVVESGKVEEIFDRPSHPYTECLMASIPSVSGNGKEKVQEIPGIVPPLHDRPSGCAFHPSCPKVMDQCLKEPPMIEATHGHNVRCWIYA